MGYMVIQNLLTPQAHKQLQIKDSVFKFKQYGDSVCYFKSIIE